MPARCVATVSMRRVTNGSIECLMWGIFIGQSETLFTRILFNMTTVTLIGMIYKSVKYLDFMWSQMQRYCQSSKYKIQYLVIANDATDSILKRLAEKKIPYLVYKDEKHDYYLNRVYRAWNFGGMSVKSDAIIFVNSDMAFTPGWIDALMARLNSETIPCSRLIESGKLKSGELAISKDFGRTVDEFDEDRFLEYAKTVSIKMVCKGGLYMPCAFYTKDFSLSGGYPEGNIHAGGVGDSSTKVLESGDRHFFYSNQVMRTKKHITVYDSIVYHIQEGEIDE